MITPAQWMGLCGRTESDLPQAWPYIMWVVRNRVESKRILFGVTPEKIAAGIAYESVILHPDQFSAFNGVTGSPNEIYQKVKARHLHLLAAAEACAEWVLATPMSGSPVSSRTYYFWAPQSMKPPGRLPPWNWSILRRFCPTPLIDPQHLTMAEEIRR